ncbi:hypothetical protein DVS28_b0077 (plasmid) [Euzebya pacifica]|uniref:Uncharacterized protein n=1 Tax=Euzebya pacifica TaxID=1608957 RepID=A0A346Y5V0_9ACTN|nr:hypothetical protein DVS28_b0077 [Euzebya pacifica]
MADAAKRPSHSPTAKSLNTAAAESAHPDDTIKPAAATPTRSGSGRASAAARRNRLTAVRHRFC